jgi:hypothetical protein
MQDEITSKVQKISMPPMLATKLAQPQSDLTVDGQFHTGMADS